MFYSVCMYWNMCAWRSEHKTFPSLHILNYWIMFYEQPRRGHFHILDFHLPMVPNFHQLTNSPTTSHIHLCGSTDLCSDPGLLAQVEKDLLRAKVHEALAVLVLACILTQARDVDVAGCGRLRWEKFRLGMVRGSLVGCLWQLWGLWPW